MKTCNECGLVNPDDAVQCPGCQASSWTPSKGPDGASEGMPAAIAADGEIICPVCLQPNPAQAGTCSRCSRGLSGGANLLPVWEAGTRGGPAPARPLPRWIALMLVGTGLGLAGIAWMQQGNPGLALLLHWIATILFFAAGGWAVWELFWRKS